MYDYSYLDAAALQSTTSAADMATITSTAGQIIGIISTISTIVAVFIMLFSVIGMWKMFKKAGYAGWKSIVPILNTITLLKIAGLSPWFILIYLAGLIPLIGSLVILVFTIYMAYKLATAFGHGIGYTLGILFLTPIFYCILGFGKSEYQGTVEQ